MITGKELVIKRLDHEQWDLPPSLAEPSPQSTTVAIPFATRTQLADLLSTLRDQNIPLAGDHAGWPPAAVFEHFRDLGLVRGSYKELVFSKPGHFTIRER